MRKRRRRNLEILAFLLYTFLIFSLSSIPGRDIPSKVSSISLLLHFILYFFYGITLFFFFRYRAFVSLIFGILYALSDELHQYFVPGRDCDPVDFLVDSLAVATSILTVYLWKQLSTSET